MKEKQKSSAFSDSQTGKFNKINGAEPPLNPPALNTDYSSKVSITDLLNRKEQPKEQDTKVDNNIVEELIKTPTSAAELEQLLSDTSKEVVTKKPIIKEESSTKIPENNSEDTDMFDMSSYPLKKELLACENLNDFIKVMRTLSVSCGLKVSFDTPDALKYLGETLNTLNRLVPEVSPLSWINKNYSMLKTKGLRETIDYYYATEVLPSFPTEVGTAVLAIKLWLI